MNTPKITCQHCRGEGERELNGALLETYMAVKRLGTPTANEVRTDLKYEGHPSAINHRINALVESGLLKELDPADGYWMKRFVVA